MNGRASFPFELREAVAKIRASQAFLRRQRPSELLGFLADEILEGRADELKETTIAVGFLGRSTNFDTKSDAAVRVLATRVREGLQEYYAEQGAADRVRVVLPKGTYLLECVLAEPETKPAPVPAPVPLPSRLPVEAPAPPAPGWRKHRELVIIVAAWVVVSALATWVRTGWHRAESPSTVVHRATALSGRAAFPSISPDGTQIVFSNRENGNWKIYLRTAAGQTSLSDHPEVDDNEPAFSPDGSMIAFRSERDGGGIFLLHLLTPERTKTSDARKISNFGFEPAWSPDGRQIAVASADLSRDISQVGSIRRSQLSLISTKDGEIRPLTNQLTTVDAVQPAWSPHGRRVAFWGINPVGNAGIYTIDAETPNATPVRVVEMHQNGCFSPFWSQSAEALYYIGNEGALALRKVAIDERSGAAKGEPQVVPFPAAAPRVLSISHDGRHVAFLEDRSQWNVESVSFDPAKETVGPLTRVTTGTLEFIRPAVSADGRSIAAQTMQPSANIYVMDVDGSNLRAVTSDDVSFGPRWLPSGELTLISGNTPTGRQQVTLIQADGSGARTLTPAATSMHGVFSPDGKQVWIRTGFRQEFTMELGQTAQPFTDPAGPGFEFTAESWSPDGRSWIGVIQPEGNRSRPARLALLTIADHKLRPYEARGLFPQWLSDSQRVIFHTPEQLMLLDVRSGREKVLLSPSNAGFFGLAVAPDDRRIYLGLRRESADIWIASLTNGL